MLCLATALAALIIDWGALELGRAPGQVASIWPGDAVILVMMLLADGRGAWPRFAAAALGAFAAELIWGDPLAVCVSLVIANLTGVAVVFVALQRLGPLDLQRLPHVLRLLAWAAVGAVVSATLGALALGALQKMQFTAVWPRWALGDWLGYAVLGPPLLVLMSSRRLEPASRLKPWQAAAVLVAYTALIVEVFSQVKYPLLFLVPLALFAVAYLVELEGVMIAVLILVVVSAALSTVGRGPGAVIQATEPQRLVILQVFLASITVSFLPISAIMTERRRLEQALREARSAAETASAMKSEFLATISHELRTPLASILGFAGMLGRDPGLRQQDREHAESITVAGNALLTTANDLLAFSELEAGRLEVRPDPADLGRVAAEALRVVQATATAKGLTLSVMASSQLPAAVMVDQGRIRQVLLNLLANAVKFTEEGKVTLRLDYDHALQRLLVAVSDTGPGLEPDRIPHLFDRFSRADAVSLRRHGGTGLGLAICKGIVEAMGGALAVESAKGRGSTFSFSIPAPPAAPRAEAALDIAATLRPRSRSLLLAGPLTADPDWARDVLEPLQLRIAQAEDTAGTLALAEDQAFDLILVDAECDAVDALGLARAIRAGAGPSRLSLLVAAVGAGGADQDALRAASFDAWISKPISPQQLIGLVMSAHRREPPDQASPQGSDRTVAPSAADAASD